MWKVVYKQALGKDGEKSREIIRHGIGLFLTLPKERDGTPEFSNLTRKESDNGGLEKVKVNVKRSISSSVQDRSSECDVRADRLLNHNNSKSSSLCMSKKVWKLLGSSLSVNVMDKVKNF